MLEKAVAVGFAGCAFLIVLIAATTGSVVAVLTGTNEPSGCATNTPTTTPVAGYGPDQLSNAATIVATGKQHNIPPQGWVIAISAALQESELRNLNHGDRDSLGLFQQRPSQGWGSPAQILNPAYSATQFYQHLQAVPDWQHRRVTDAAQAVQHSGTPQAYAHHEISAHTLINTVQTAVCRPSPAA